MITEKTIEDRCVYYLEKEKVIKDRTLTYKKLDCQFCDGYGEVAKILYLNCYYPKKDFEKDLINITEFKKK